MVIILLDDLGYSDLGCYGSEISTPNIDALAAAGTSFNQFYVYPRCSPSRAAMLTGRSPHQVGLGFLTTAANAPDNPGPYQGYLTADAPTLASILQASGYATYMAGKWHLGEASEHWPRRYGFDRYFGLISGASSYYELRERPGAMPRIMALDDERWTPPSDGAFFMTDAFTDAAVAYLHDHAAATPAKPFFLYLAYTAPHWPLHASEEDIGAYDGVYDSGWDTIRQARAQRLAALGFDPRSLPAATPPSTVGAWEDYADKADWVRKMQTHAAMVTHADRGVGAVLDKLRRTGQLDNTLIILCSDNGASAESVAARGLNDETAAIGSRTSYVAFEEVGAFTANTPFRNYKGTTYEGGIRSPLIAVAPRGGPANARDAESVLSIIDIAPTVLDVTGASLATANTLEGHSFGPALQAARPAVLNHPVFLEHLRWHGMRDGRWKLVRQASADTWELYDLSIDPSESHNVADEHPDIVEDMSARWQAWADRVGARPITSEELRNFGAG